MFDPDGAASGEAGRVRGGGGATLFAVPRLFCWAGCEARGGGWRGTGVEEPNVAVGPQGTPAPVAVVAEDVV